MNQLFEWLAHLVTSWKFWIVVAPWEVGVRIRLGHVSRNLAPGPHWRVPFLDQITLINTRLRIASTPPVTIAGTRKGKVRTTTATVGYRISDPNAAMLRYSHPETAVLSLAQAEVAAGATPGDAGDRLHTALCGHGIAVEFVRYVEDVEVKAIRLLNNSWGLSQGTCDPIGHVERY